MAGERLLTLAEMLASFPDNTQRLITPLDARSMIVSEAVNVAYLAEDDPGGYTVPITNGVYVSAQSGIVTPVFVSNYWKLGAGNAFVPAYTDQGITVNPGTNRLTSVRMTIEVSKVGGGTAQYDVAVFLGGVQLGTAATVTIGSTPELVSLTKDLIQDMSLTDGLDFRIAGVGTSDDLQVTEAGFRASGAPL